jgi:hypothetical protein
MSMNIKQELEIIEEGLRDPRVNLLNFAAGLQRARAEIERLEGEVRSERALRGKTSNDYDAVIAALRQALREAQDQATQHSCGYGS